LMAHPNPEVRYRALLSVQQLVSQPWIAAWGWTIHLCYIVHFLSATLIRITTPWTKRKHKWDYIAVMVTANSRKAVWR
jgi:hypothetical protein